MEIVNLTTESFRNLAPRRFDFHPRLNLIVGENGQGKTNLLEALAIVSGRGSFRTSELGALLREGSGSAAVAVTVRGKGPACTFGVRFGSGQREHVREDRRISRLQALSAVPSVFLTGRDLTRFTGPAAERRKALDRIAFAADAAHGDALRAYERARASKARLLTAAFDRDELAVYEDLLVESGARIAAARRAARVRLEAELVRNARRLESPFSPLSLRLVSDLPADGGPDELADALRRKMAARASEERRARRCLVGPHRDDLELWSGGATVADRASSGESRTLVLAWTLAELALLADENAGAPILAFDDFDSEWDRGVLRGFARAVPERAQLFLTSARPEAVRELPLPAGELLWISRGDLERKALVEAAVVEA